METGSGSAISQYANGLDSSATQMAAFSYENLRLGLRLDFEGNLNIRRLKTSLRLWLCGKDTFRITMIMENVIGGRSGQL